MCTILNATNWVLRADLEKRNARRNGTFQFYSKRFVDREIWQGSEGVFLANKVMTFSRVIMQMKKSCIYSN